MSHPSPENCAECPAHHVGNLIKLGVDMSDYDYVVALAGNPNTGKSTVFNALTGLRQHVGNWPGKTVSRAEGGFSYQGQRYKLIAGSDGSLELYDVVSDPMEITNLAESKPEIVAEMREALQAFNEGKLPTSGR